MKLKAIYIIPALLCLLFSCTARIDISTKAGKEHLVIYGYLTDELGYHYIKITRSTGYFATEAPEGVSGADVKISTPTTVIHLYEYEPKSGMYIMERMYQGIEGEEYTLDVSLDFNNDGEMERYTASSQLPFAARVDSIDVQKSDALNHRVEVLLYGQLPDSDENHFIFQISRNNQSLDDSLSKFSLISDKYLTEKVINRLPVYFLDQEEEEEKLYKGDILELKVKTITKEYYTFLSDAQDEVWGKIPIFSGPPANIKTNITQVEGENEIPLVGFFTAYSGDAKSVLVQEDYGE